MQLAHCRRRLCPPCRPADMLPKGVREKLLRIAAHVKAKHKEQLRAEEGSRGRNLATRLVLDPVRKMSGAI